MDDPFDADECGGDELDDSGFIVQSVHIFSADWLGESMVWYFVLFDEAPVKAVYRGSTINEGFGDDIFIESVFEDRQGDAE